MRLCRKLVCGAALLLSLCGGLFGGDKYFSWDFSDCDIKDVLFAVSMDTGVPILADSTVSGKCDLRFIGNDFSHAFDSFLESCRLYADKSGDVWKVSRVRVHEEKGLFNTDAFDTLPSVILEKISEKTDAVITFDSLPSSPVSLHFKALSLKELMESLARSFGPYECVKSEKGFHFVRKNENQMRRNGNAEGFVRIMRNGSGGFDVDVREGTFLEVLDRLFYIADEGERSFCVFSNGETKLLRTVFSGKDFEDTLEKLCSQNGFKCVQSDGIYYFASDNSTKLNLVYGKRNWERFDLKFSKADSFLLLVTKQLGKLESFCLPNKSAFYAFVNEEEKLLITKLVEDSDQKLLSHLVNLKFLKPDEFLKHLPPDFNRESFSLADDNSCLYFTGTREAYENLCSKIEVCDQPVQRISYDLLILQYDEGNQNSWTPVFSAEKMAMGDRTAASALLGNVMNLNMNVVGAFGMNFAASLQASIEENKTKVFADTTLHGVNGKKINFQNTNTYRYRDNNLDPETGKPVYSGVTREITSGIKLEILGWVSGDGMITSSVTASLSRQGTDTSSSTGNPPPTTEKIVTTEVRGKSGEPVVLSGLVQNSDTKEEKRVPFISKIPLIGLLFKHKAKITEKSQMVIYLVPHLDGYERSEALYDQKWAEGRISGILRDYKKTEVKNEGI